MFRNLRLQGQAAAFQVSLCGFALMLGSVAARAVSTCCSTAAQPGSRPKSEKVSESGLVRALTYGSGPPGADSNEGANMNRTSRSTRIRSTREAGVENIMTDIWVVISEAFNGKRSARCVLAGDEDQARHAHLEHYPDEQIVTVRPRRTPA